jgi:LysR substrate binding domain.
LRLTLCHGGIGFFPGLIAAEAVASSRLQPLLNQWQAPEGALFLITLSAPRAPARVQAFKQFLLEQVAAGAEEKERQDGFEK